MADPPHKDCAEDGGKIFVTNDSVRKGKNDFRQKQGGKAVLAGQNRTDAKDFSVVEYLCLFHTFNKRGGDRVQLAPGSGKDQDE